ncbi:MAG: AraC family transcriptional regulator [Nocardioidaceae bacterium]|nr:AraC family transcriptional regulator [Nocardioidaceae bacterium]
MGVLDDVLDGTRARGGLFVQMVLDPPWSMRVDDGSTLALLVAARGVAVVVVDDEPPAVLGPGDVALVRGTFTVADDAATPPHLVLGADGDARWLTDAPAAAALDGPHAYGSGPTGGTLLVAGTFALSGEVADRLLTALPRVAVVPAADVPAGVARLLDDELGRDDPGQRLVLDRWLDLALVTTLRAWFAHPDVEPPGWYAAHDDDAVRAVLALVHEDPAHPWTLVELADRAGLSRAALAERFTSLVGEPPMAYLTQWRLTLAAEQLRTTDAAVESIAQRVGYSSAFALSAAFKRVRGTSPAEHRRAGRTPA